MTWWLLGTVVAAPSTTEARPLLYLDEATVREYLHAGLPSLDRCFEDVDEAITSFELVLTLGPDGAASAPRLFPSAPEREACLADALGNLLFPPHHEDPVEVRTILVPRGGGLVPHPTVELGQRPESLLFVYIADPAVAEKVRADLTRATGAP